MTQPSSNADTQIANFAGVILVITFVLIFVLIANSTDSTAPESDSGQAVAQVVPTDTPQPTDAPTNTSEPTATLLPPTETPEPPTATPIPPTETPEPPTETPQAVADSGQGDGGATAVDSDLAAQGESLFILCAACHGPDARGVPGLGKDLVDSEFVISLTDEELADFIITGRPIWDPENTTGLDMPAKGGNPAMSNDDIDAIVAYIRLLAGGDAGSGTAAPADDTTTDSSESSDETASNVDVELATQGESLFILCAACHGPDARGVPGLGKDLVDSEFVISLTDEELADFIITGRPIWDPENTTGLDMPAKGGNPAMSNDDIDAIVAYIRLLATDGS